jgi:hypothetical protein
MEIGIDSFAAAPKSDLTSAQAVGQDVSPLVNAP